MKWQSIKTAPREPSLVVLVFDPMLGVVPAGRNTELTPDETDLVCIEGWETFGQDWFGNCEPTHWMPMPEPPQSVRRRRR